MSKKAASQKNPICCLWGDARQWCALGPGKEEGWIFKILCRLSGIELCYQTWPFPSTKNIHDLLDQLGSPDAVYLSTLDFKSGYWQIKVHTCSQEKTAIMGSMNQGNTLWDNKCLGSILVFNAACFVWVTDRRRQIHICVCWRCADIF